MDDKNTLLGKPTTYPRDYAPDVLQSLPRSDGRRALGLNEECRLPFFGADLWTAYELSWSDQNGKPEVAIGEFTVPCDSICTVESKSLKLYLGSLHGVRFASRQRVVETLVRDLSAVCGAGVSVALFSLDEYLAKGFGKLPGQCLDGLSIICGNDEPRAEVLALAGTTVIEETLHSHLLRSQCPVTGQPDWASLLIHYRGRAINRECLLRYIVAYRQHSGFHEQCVEKIFMDIVSACAPESLRVTARYTRRGGIDINPLRTSSGGGLAGGEGAAWLRTSRQ